MSKEEEEAEPREWSKSLGEEQHDEDGISNDAMTHARSQSPPSNPTFPSTNIVTFYSTFVFNFTIINIP
jgi:hypothetical protein